MALPGDQQVVEALGPDGAHPALGIAVRPRRTVRGADDFEPLGGEHTVEGRRELRIPIVDEVAKGTALILQRPGEVARLLGDPSRRGMWRAPGQTDAAGALCWPFTLSTPRFWHSRIWTASESLRIE